MSMKWIEQASYACAARWSKKYCATVSANSIRFISPILVEQIFTVTARIVHTGKQVCIFTLTCDRPAGPKEASSVITNSALLPLWLLMSQATL